MKPITETWKDFKYHRTYHKHYSLF